MFKRGAFDLGATVCPVAIKYDAVFVDAFWNSKRQSFTAHLVRGGGRGGGGGGGRRAAGGGQRAADVHSPALRLGKSLASQILT